MATIKTKRLEIRPLTFLDTEALFHCLNDCQVLQYLGKIDEKDLRNLAVSHTALEGFWGIFKGEELIGEIDFHETRFPRIYELGYLLNSKYFHQGYAFEALEVFLSNIESNVREVIVSIDSSNEPSIKLASKLGFTKKEKNLLYDTKQEYQRLFNINTPWKIGNVSINNRVVLAPMAGICNIAFREICLDKNAGLVYAEMVSDKGINYSNQKSLNMLRVGEKEHPISMQIFGSDKDSILKAALVVDKTNADIIDINMGCPVNKIAKKSESGSALLKDPNKIYEIVKAVVDNVSKPVTVKIRSGWDSTMINACEVARMVEKAGASAIAVHPRTRSQMYTGIADWNVIKDVKKAVSIPVIGNGDIKTKTDALRMLELTNCDAVMIGRGALGNPWLFDEINSYLSGKEIKKISYSDIKEMIKYHTNRLIELKCEKIAILEMRSHAAWYLSGIKNAKAFKNELYRCKTKEELFKLVDDFFSQI